MIVIQVLGIPLIAILLLGTIFVIGTQGVEQPGYPGWDEQNNLTNIDPDMAQATAPAGLPRHGCNL